MRHEQLYVAGVGAYFPKGVPVDDAIAAGQYSAEARERSGQRRVAVASDDDTQPSMAVRAGRQALARSGHAAGDVGLLLHAVSNYNGLDAWNAAAYLQREVLGGSGVSFEIRQLSNGALGSVELAAHHLAGTGAPAAMVTAADQFAEPYWDRWTSNVGMVFADGASAAVLSQRGGFARVRSLVSVCDADLEGLQRGDQPFQAGPDPGEFPVSLWLRSLEFFDAMDLAEADRRMTEGLRSCAHRAAQEAGIDIGAATHYIVPNFGRDLVEKDCLAPLGIDIDRTTWEWGRQIGHSGTADQFGALNHLVESDRLGTGDLVMLISVGGGFNWTCMVIEIIQAPNSYMPV
jgi:3-oxoacyl-[acyl-carrier-protein] synthase III